MPSTNLALLILLSNKAADGLLDDMDSLDTVSASRRVTVVHLNPPPTPAHHRVLAKLEADWPEGFTPFSTDPFLPIAHVDEAGLKASLLSA